MQEFVVGVAVVLILLLLALTVYMGLAPLSVWSAEYRGKADYAHAESNRRIAVLEAQAKKDSAKLLAESEIERAKGIAEANQIIGDSLKGNDDYLRYLWIDSMAHSNDNSIIYIPTEAGLPILEASRLKNK